MMSGKLLSKSEMDRAMAGEMGYTFSVEVGLFIENFPSAQSVIQSQEAKEWMSSLLIRIGITPNTACHSCVMGQFNHLQSFVNKKSSTMSKQIKGWAGKRYVLPEGQRVMPFGTGIYYSNADLTDEMVQKFEKQNPGFISQFIDTWEGKEEPELPAGDQGESKDMTAGGLVEGPKKSGLTITKTPAVGVSDLPESPAGDQGEKSADPPSVQDQQIDYEKKDPKRYFQYDEAFNVPQLTDKYIELTGKKMAGRPNKRALIFAIMKEEDALKELKK